MEQARHGETFDSAGPWILVGIAAMYFAAGRLGLSFATVHSSASAVWPPTGIALAALLLLGYRAWPAILAGAFLVNYTTSGSILASAGIAAGNLGEGLAGAWLLQRHAHGADCFRRARDIFKFAGLASLACTVAATVGTATLVATGLAPSAQFGAIWLTWWTGDFAGALVVTPLLVLWAQGRPVEMAAGELVEVVLTFMVVLAVGVTCFAVPTVSRYPLAFLCLAPLAWLAFRSGPREVATAIATLTAIAVFTTEHGLGPFVTATRNESMLVLLAFMATLALTMLPIAALVNEIAHAIEARERSALEERRARADAESAMKAKDQFLAMLSHELRNPLQAIGNSTYLLERCNRNDSMGDKSLGVIRRQTENLTRMVNDLLDVARAASGKIVIIRQAVNLEKSMRRCLDVLGDAGRLADHRVEIEAEEAWVHADPTRVEQMLLNLLGNALKFTPKGGTIRIFVMRDGASAVVRVEDTGIGMGAELLPHIFEPFSQGKQRSSDRREGGLGVGLSLVRELSRLHGGRVEATSAGPGQGSRFVLSLPLGRIQAVAPVAESPGGGGKRVLVVEGEAGAGGSMRAMLEAAGFEVFHALDARAALHAALTMRPQAVVVDVSLAGIDGYEVARELRGRGAEIGTALRLVAVAHYASLRPAGDEEGLFDERLVKPVDIASLRRALEGAVVVGDG